MRSKQDELAGRIGGWYGTILLNTGRADEAVEWSSRALQAVPSELAETTFTRFIYLAALASRGDTDEVLRAAFSVPEHAQDARMEDFEQLLARGMARLWAGQRREAKADLSRSVDLAQELSAVHLVVPTLFYLSDAEYRLGEWDAAIMHGELAASTAEDTDQVFLTGIPHAVAAYPYIGRGEWQTAERHIAIAERVAALVGDFGSVGFAATARARFWLMRGQPLPAMKALEPFIGLDLPPTREPGIFPLQLLHAEALLQHEDFEAAAGMLNLEERRIRERGLAPLLITAARLRGELYARTGQAEQALETFECGLSACDPGLAPFESARLELSYGSILRRLGQRRAAREHLEAGYGRLLPLRAAPLLERCEAELAGLGLRTVRRTADEREQLTSQELAVARLAAEGLTNREVAAKLVVSAKTVEFHLGNVYGKLGISSRTQLARQFAEAGAPAR